MKSVLQRNSNGISKLLEFMDPNSATYYSILTKFTNITKALAKIGDPDPEGFYVQRYRYAIKNSKPNSTFHGKYGSLNLNGSLLLLLTGGYFDN